MGCLSSTKGKVTTKTTTFIKNKNFLPRLKSTPKRQLEGQLFLITLDLLSRRVIAI